MGKKSLEKIGILESIDSGDEDLMEVRFLGELKVYEPALPTDVGKMVFSEEEVKDSLGFGEENVLDEGAQGGLELSIGLSLDA